jgi:glycosyltransferase involved in cell wall biosynthesis
VNCLKCDFWDEDEMANQIVGLLKNQPLRQELHRNSYREFERMSWTSAADKLMNIYKHHTEKVLA